MRGSVWLTDVCLFLPILLTVLPIFDSSDKKHQSPLSKHCWLFLLLICPPLLLIDHGHFQYNHVPLGLTLLSSFFLLKGLNSIFWYLFMFQGAISSPLCCSSSLSPSNKCHCTTLQCSFSPFWEVVCWRGEGGSWEGFWRLGRWVWSSFLPSHSSSPPLSPPPPPWTILPKVSLHEVFKFVLWNSSSSSVPLR